MLFQKRRYIRRRYDSGRRHLFEMTGVEMEALTAVTVAALAVVDMVKGIDRSAVVAEAKIVAKSGGRSGNWVRPED